MISTRAGQLGALGQQDRLRIFRMLVRAGAPGCCVDEIKRRFKMPGSTLSHHLDALTRCGLLGARRSGRFIYYAINWRETANLIRFLVEDCCAGMNLPESGSSSSEPCNSIQAPCCSERGATRRVKQAGAVKRPHTDNVI